MSAVSTWVPLVSLVPRNGHEEDLNVRAAVRETLAAHSPLAKPLTAKAINAKLPAHLRRSDGAIRHHMRRVWEGK